MKKGTKIVLALVLLVAGASIFDEIKNQKSIGSNLKSK